jgi:hypothetical protein
VVKAAAQGDKAGVANVVPAIWGKADITRNRPNVRRTLSPRSRELVKAFDHRVICLAEKKAEAR